MMAHTSCTTTAAKPVQKVVIVNGNAELLGLLETVLDAGRYDMVFVESSGRAYSQIRKVLPDLIILCARIEDLDTFTLLTMVKLDDETRNIPILTYTADFDGKELDETLSPFSDDEALRPARPAPRMN